MTDWRSYRKKLAPAPGETRQVRRRREIVKAKVLRSAEIRQKRRAK